MIPEPTLRWILTIAFAAVGAFCVYRCVRHGGAAHRVSDLLHIAMCAGMIAMAWPAGMNLARVPQILLFSAAAVWFAGLLVFDVRGHHGKLSLGYHAAMLAAMAWMVLVMPAPMSGMTMAEMPTGGEHAGMSMGAGTMTLDAPPHVTVVALVLTAGFLVAGVFWLARAIDTARVADGPRLPAAGLAVDAVMGLGMAVMTGLLI
ncbi:DUF5134 domain-containing protein [Amycolatopsis acidicola]|uniref:DUF5134 domain-containing protein n=1 Tax=Amycolatopsis acidicola TaxID=2596893 RepID=A0A5N0UYB5_9PSEU|nr:DUF5134 domain-containing protein [Amycolatopsis acidicola]KAA9154667.1 DUF5134 domain-containing protein [Amycolatopsis acidicola]